MRLRLVPGALAVCRLEPDAEPPRRPAGAELFAVTWTKDELSVVCPEACATGTAQLGWRALVVDGPMAFDVVGVAAALTAPLAAAGIPLLLIATYDTDWVLVSSDHLQHAITALRAAGHEVSENVAPE